MHAQASSPDSSLSLDIVVQRCLDGDQSAWDDIVHRHRRKVFNVAYQFVGKYDEAEDLTQDIFLRIFKSLKTFDRRANFQTWLFSISRNLCIDHYRTVRRERQTIDRRVDTADLWPVAKTPSAYAEVERRDRVELLRAALDGLAPILRTAVLMRDIREMTYREIADALDVPEGTVKSRINRGRAELALEVRRLREQQTIGATGGADSPARRGAMGPDTGVTE